MEKMNNPEKHISNIFGSGLKTPDFPGVDQNVWKYNPDTNNYDLVEKQEPDNQVDKTEITPKPT